MRGSPCCLFSPVSRPDPAADARALKVGFVYVAPLTEAGWVRQHDEGRKAVEAALGGKVKTSYVENVAEGADAERVIRDLAQQGHKLIFTPSFGYMEPTLKVAQGLPRREVRVDHRLQDRAQRRDGQRALLRGPLPGGHRRRRA